MKGVFIGSFFIRVLYGINSLAHLALQHHLQKHEVVLTPKQNNLTAQLFLRPSKTISLQKHIEM